MKNLISFATAAALLAPTFAIAEEAAPPIETKEQQEKRMEWWHEAKFGMFIHWGIYSVVGGQYKGKELPTAPSG